MNYPLRSLDLFPLWTMPASLALRNSLVRSLEHSLRSVSSFAIMYSPVFGPFILHFLFVRERQTYPQDSMSYFHPSVHRGVIKHFMTSNYPLAESRLPQGPVPHADLDPVAGKGGLRSHRYRKRVFGSSPTHTAERKEPLVYRSAQTRSIALCSRI